jgi:hypothetical protein
MMRIPRLVQVSDVQVRVHRDHVHVVFVPAPSMIQTLENENFIVNL